MGHKLVDNEVFEQMQKVFKERLILLCKETYKYTKEGYNPSFLSGVLNDKFLTSKEWIESICNFIIKGSEGLDKLKPYGKGGLALSLEAVILENRDFSKLFDDDILEACRFNLKRVGYYD